MAWSLLTQTEGRGDKAREVLCKEIRFLPIEDRKTGDTSFMPLKFLVLKVKFQHSVERKEHSITYSNRAGGEGKFIYHWPDKKTQPDTEFVGFEALRRGLVGRGTLADDILDLFANKLAEVASSA